MVLGLKSTISLSPPKNRMLYLLSNFTLVFLFFVILPKLSKWLPKLGEYLLFFSVFEGVETLFPSQSILKLSPKAFDISSEILTKE